MMNEIGAFISGIAYPGLSDVARYTTGAGYPGARSAFGMVLHTHTNTHTHNDAIMALATIGNDCGRARHWYLSIIGN
jgi:hypothetical protein